MMNARRNALGFTLVELMITVAIVGVLASVALPLAELSVQRAREQELRVALRQLRDAIDAYKAASDEGRVAKLVGKPGYPPTLEALVEGVEDKRNPNKSKIYFMRRIPRDPFARDAALAPAQTWGKRSYASPPEDPSEGDDVFDVYSLAAGAGLNGVPYREW